MSDFGVLDLEEMMGEGSRLSTSNDSEGGSNWLDMYVPMPDVKPGKTGFVTVRILPPAKGGRIFQFTRLHSINERKYHCPKPLVNGKWDRDTPCPICDYYNALWREIDRLEDKGDKDGAEQLKKEARALKPVERYYYNAIVREIRTDKGVEKNVGPRILSVGKVLHKLIIRAIVGDESQKPIGDVTHPKNGYDLVISKEMRGTGDNAYPNYDRSAFDRESSPLGTADEIAKWSESLHDLTKLRTVKDFEELEKQLAIHRGLLPDDAEAKWSIEKFDSKFKKSGTAPCVKPATSSVNVEEVVDNCEMPTAPAPAPQQDVMVDVEEFARELREIEGQ